MPPKEDIFIEKNQVNLKFLAAKMIRNWYWFIISLFLCLCVSYIYLRYTAPVFKTVAKVLIAKDKTETPGEDALAQALGGQFSTTSNVEGEAEILKTRNLMEKVVRDLKSYITYYHKGQIRSVNLYQSAPFKLTLLDKPDSIKRAVSLDVKINGSRVSLSNAGGYQKEVNLYQPFVIPGLGRAQIESGFQAANKNDVYIVTVSTLRQTVENLIGTLDVSIPIKQVDLLALSFTDQIPKKSEDILNKLIEEYIHGNIVDKNKIADSTIAFIDNRLAFVGEELGHIEGNVQTFKQQNKIADISAQSGLLVTSTGDYIEQQAKVEMQLSILNSIEAYLNQTGAGQHIIPSGALLDDPAFATLVDRYNVIVLEKEKAGLSQTEANPYMQNLNTQIAGAKADMLSSLRSLKKTLNISKSKIEARSGTLAGQVKKVPAVERNYLDLTRQQEIKQTLYVFLLQKKEETAISKTSNISNCKIIEPPMSFGPISPIRTNVIGYGFVAGLFLPFLVIFLGDRLNTRISSKEQVSAKTNVPIIGEIGKSDENAKTLVVYQGSRTPISEQFRSLRTNLAFFMKENEKTILLTSSMSGEGKSFISLNLATVLAISGKKVVVMEMDLRKPNLSNKLNLKNNFGFTSYIVSKELTADEIISASGSHENLFVISSGNIPPNPTEIILNERMDILMKNLAEKFDYIIIDAPPIGMVTDAQLLNKYADLTLYVVRQGYTFKDQLEIPEEIYRTEKMKNIAIIMNDVKHQGGYGYGYGYGYGIEQENKGVFARLFKK